MAAYTLDVSRYDLFIDLDFQGLEYKGVVGITLKTERDVVLDSIGLDIKRIHSEDTNLRFQLDNENLTIQTGAFDGLLQIEFAGRIPNSLAGIYNAPYDHNHIVTTHFEPAQARRMFPCADRPVAKAEFKLSVRIDNELEAISNMPVENQKRDGNKKVVTFQTTPRMSTYLLYLGVGEFQTRTSKAGETEVVVATTPGKVELGAFAEEEARKALGFFNSYYKIPYSLPKVHLIAVPEFPMGAMENWGAISFREVRLLVDQNTSSETKRRAAMAIVHELAHQWFGDLVTMKWWDEIWLSESFATFMAYKAIDHMHPEWSIWENFFNGKPDEESLTGAMGQDSMHNTHPIQVPVNSPDELEQVFDAISYGKGAHVLQMIEAYVGEESFSEGVRRYLATHAYSNATGEDLWSAIESASEKPVRKIMSAWIRQPGFPLVTVQLDGEELKLHQSRMIISGKQEKTTWPVPIILEVNGQRRDLLMESSEVTVKVGDLKTLRINPDRTGFYAVNNRQVADVVWRSGPSAYDRWGIIFDAFQFLLSGMMKFSEYKSVLDRFEHEDEYLPAQEVSNQLGVLYVLSPSRITPISRRFHRVLLDRFTQKSGEKSSILCGTLASRLAQIDPEYARNLASRFNDYENISPDMRAAVAIAYAKTTNDLDKLISAYRRSGSDEDKNTLLGAMTVFDQEELVKKALDFAFSGEVKRQDMIFAVAGAVANPAVRNMVWDWMKRNLGRLQELYQGTGLLSKLSSLIPILCVGRVEEAERYFAAHMIPGGETAIKLGLEKLHAYDRLAKEIANEISEV